MDSLIFKKLNFYHTAKKHLEKKKLDYFFSLKKKLVEKEVLNIFCYVIYTI
jgi:hypothetical protein